MRGAARGNPHGHRPALRNGGPRGRGTVQGRGHHRRGRFRGRPGTPQRIGPGGAHCPAGKRADLQGTRYAGLRHPFRAFRALLSRAMPGGRCAFRSRPASEGHAVSHREQAEAYGQPQHSRTSPAPGRQDQNTVRKPRGGYSCFVRTDHLRGERGPEAPCAGRGRI